MSTSDYSDMIPSFNDVWYSLRCSCCDYTVLAKKKGLVNAAQEIADRNFAPCGRGASVIIEPATRTEGE